MAINCLCFLAYFICHTCFTAHWAANLQRSSIALLGYSWLSAKVLVTVDVLREFVAGGFVSTVVADINELAAAWFSHWHRFFAAFFEVVVVSMVTKKGKVVFNTCKRRDSEGRVQRLSID